jgi:hypothetical protein
MGGGGFLGLGPAPSAPAAPDYRGAASETAAGNLEAARANIAANRVNQITPYGSLTYKISGEDKYGNPMWTATQELSPDQQKLYEYDIAASKGLGELSQTGLNYVRNMMANPFGAGNFQNMSQPSGQMSPQMPATYEEYLAQQGPQMTMEVKPWQQGQYAGMSPKEAYEKYVQSPEAQPQFIGGQTGGATGLAGLRNVPSTGLPPLIGQVNPANLQQIAGGPQLGQIGGAEAQLRAGQSPELQTSLGQNVGMQGWDRASNLLMSRLDPQLQRQEQRLDAQLAAQGIPIGSEAYTRAKQDLAMQQNDARIQAQLQAQGIQQNLFGQELAAGQFGNQAMLGQNQAQLANLGFTNQAQQQDFANRMAALGYNNQQIQQMYQNQVAQQQANNAIAQQLYGNQFTAADLANRARLQGFNELAYMRNEPLNTLNAVRSGAQVTGPNFVNPAQQAVTAGPDYLSASQMGYNALMGDFNAKQAAQANLNQGLFQLGGSAIMMSDIRLKENIKPVGVMDNGLTLYSFEYVDEVKSHPLAGKGIHVGVMAQEVEQVFPYAVRTLDDGYKVVDYGLLP